MDATRNFESPLLRQPRMSLWTLPVVVLLIIGCTLSWFAYDEYTQTIELEFLALESNGRIAEAQVTSLLRSIEQLLSVVAHEQKTLTAAQRAGYDELLAERKSLFPELRSLVAIDAQGRVESSATPKLKGFDSSQRDYFVAHLAKPLQPNFYVSRPFRTATGNDMSIAFSVAMRDESGNFLGTAVSGVDPKYFEAVLRQVRPLGEGAVAALFNRHGDFIYRVPNAEKFMEASLAGSQVVKEHLAANVPLTRHIGVSTVDGVKRIYAISRVGNTGISVAVSRPFDDVLVNWHRNILVRAAIFALTAAVTLGLAWIAQRRQREREEAEARLYRERGISDDIIDSLPGVFYMFDASGHFVRWNKRFEAITGYSADEISEKHPLELIGPGDRRSVEKSIAQAFAAGDASTEAMLLDSRGRETAYHFTGHLSSFECRQYVLGIGEDITERRKADEELRLAASIFHVSSEGMLISDAENRIIAINPAFTEITGYTIDDLLGKDPRLLKSGRHDVAFYRDMWQSLNATGQWRGDIWDRNKDGSIIAKRLTINTLYNADGRVERYVALSSDITKKIEAEETIWRQANFDTLTGLPNRRLFHDRLAQEMKKIERSDQTLAILFIDLDHFKEVNDTRGHELGDLLLGEAAARISACVRESDTVARLGGDEFTVVIPGVPDTLHIDRVAQTILEVLQKPFMLHGEDAFISASIGITIYPTDASDIESLMKNADQAMYEAKNKGRNGYSYFFAAMQDAARSRQQLIRELRGAVAGGQLAVHYQPIVELATGRIFKAEALLRWRHPQLGMVSPMEFIPLAEETGLIHEIGDWVFRTTSLFAKRWHAARQGTADLQISVNKSPRQFVSGDTDTTWVVYLEEIGLPANCLVIEITEGLLLDTRAEVTQKLAQFRSKGIQISLDDFGTGYSAMAYLKKFPIDYLKIDKSFVRDMASDPGDLAIVEAIIVMAHKLGLRVIAEGVETQEQRNLLQAAGCDFGQGYLFSRPLPEEDFEALLRNRTHGQTP